MDRIDELIEKLLVSYLNMTVEVKTAYDFNNARSALRAEFDAQAARIAELEEILLDYREDTSRVLNEQCPTDERHCGCVPTLRKSNRCYRNALALIITLNELSEIITVANKALNENFSDYSMAKACGEYWADKFGVLQDDYADVCQKRLEAAESFSLLQIEMQREAENLNAEINAGLRRENDLEHELAALKEALDISHKNHDRCNRDYVLLKKHLDGINRAVDALGPKVARAISKLTPPSIADMYLADHQFARELRAALDAVTDAQNTVYKPEAE